MWMVVFAVVDRIDMCDSTRNMITNNASKLTFYFINHIRIQHKLVTFELKYQLFFKENLLFNDLGFIPSKSIRNSLLVSSVLPLSSTANLPFSRRLQNIRSPSLSRVIIFILLLGLLSKDKICSRKLKTSKYFDKLQRVSYGKIISNNGLGMTLKKN